VNSLKFKILILVLLFVLSGLKLKAQSDFTEIQTFIDSSITRNFLNTTFDNGLLSSNLTSKFNFNGKFKKKYNYFLKNYYSSAVTKLGENFFRDFDNVKGGVGYDITDDINASLNYYGMFYSDEKNIQLKGSSTNMFYLGGTFDKIINGAEVNAAMNAGYKIDEQIGELNRGISLSGDLNVSNLSLSDFFLDGEVKAGIEDLNPRKNNFFITHLYTDKSFSDNLSRNEFDGFLSRIRKDFYFPADVYTQQQFDVKNNIEKRTEYILKGFDRFDYTVSSKSDLYIIINPYYRNIYKENYYIPRVTTAPPSIYDTQIQELSVIGDAVLRFNLDKLDLQFKMSYLERDEKHFLINPDRISAAFVKEKEELEASKNNHSSKFLLGSNVYYDLSRSNRLELFGNASILKYDTPSNENTDDRDELNFLVYLGHKYDNLKNFQIINSIDMNLYHTVYVFGEKSSNNNWNRVIRFISRNTFTPIEAFRTVNTISVLANYTVYDFEDIVSTVKSYSFRQFNVKDSTIINFTDYLGTDIYAELKLYERGELNWSAFSIRRVNYFEDKIINAELNYFFNKFVILSAGYRFFEQRRFNFVDGERVFNNSVKTYGPMGRFRVLLNDNSMIEIISSYDFYRYGNIQPSSSNGNLYMNVRWNF
jgi:hypothetical protein